MAYIDQHYYKCEFNGAAIPQEDFTRLVDIASDVIDSIVTTPIVLEDLSEDTRKLLSKATAYEAELLYQQGGIDSITGFSAENIGSESLGSYSVSNGSSGSGRQGMVSSGGIPISTMTFALLKRAGLYSRWAYAGTWRDDGRR